MDAIPEATDEDVTAAPNIFYTFHKWMLRMGRKEGTARTYARQMVVLFEEDNKSPAGMATNEYFLITKNSFKNKSGNSQRSAAVKAFMDFWTDHGSKPMEDCQGHKTFQVKTSRPTRPKAAIGPEGEEERKLRAELELPSEGWKVVVRSRESGDLIAAVSPGGTAYYSREAVDRRLGRRQPAESSTAASPSADAAKPSKEEAARSAASEERTPKKPAADAAGEAKKDKRDEAKKSDRREDKKKEKEEAKKEEAKREEAKREEAKKEEAKKEEVKAEVKGEVVKELKEEEDVKMDEVKKEEEASASDVKPEVKAEDATKEEDPKDDVFAQIQSELEAIVGPDLSEKRSRRSRKHHDKDTLDGLLSDAQEVPSGDLSTPAIETDTEYDEVDLDTCPQKVHVRDSGSHRMDGAYSRLLETSRGKPCYVKWGEKPVYLFWNKKWKIGVEFGSSKAYAMAKDAGTPTPCEPYPNVWKVIDKKDKKEKKDKGKDKEAKTYVKNMTMRVIDGEVLALSIESEVPEFIVPEEDHGHAHKRAKRRAVAPDSPGAGKAKGEAAAAGGEQSASQEARAAANGTAPSSEALGPEESDKDEEDEEEAKEAGESSQSESNSSESSSSDSGASDSEEEKKTEAKAQVKPAAPKQSPWQATEQKAAEFEMKLRNQLEKMAPAARVQKLKQVEGLLMTKCGMEQVTGMGPQKIQVLLDKLKKDYGINTAAVSSQPPPPLPKPKSPALPPKPPSLPPPAWLLQKQSGPPGAAQPEDRRSLADFYAEQRVQPTTPEQEPPVGDAAEWWRRQLPKRSALRRPGAPRQTQRRITYRNDGWLINQVDVASFRTCGEQLWFVAPGAYVACDKCEKEVSQAMGCLQGAPGLSQFAQHQFLCSDCTGM